VRWTAADGNGSDVTGYSVLASPGGRSCVTTIALSCVITGLTNGTDYTFAVSATSIIGTSLPRVSEVVTPAGVSTAPVSVTAKAGNKAATVSWKKPSSNGGEAITSYLVIASPGGARCVTESGSVTSCTLTGLTNGKAYTFSVIAVNSVGNSLPSTSSTAVTPTAKPFAPTAVTPTSLRAGVVKLAWSGAKRNGATLIKYEYQFRLKSNQPWSAWKSVGTNTSVTLKSLTKGKAYQLKVRITTSVGEATSKVMPFTPTK
jgi:predicted phage tail protein